MAGVFILNAIAVLFMLGGALSLTNATLGVGSICAACLFAIFARIAQAGAHHRAVLAALQRGETRPAATSAGAAASVSPAG